MWDEVRVLDIAEGTKGYEPWPSVEVLHNSPASFVLLSGAERVGKSMATAMEGLAWFPFSKLIWIVGPQYRDTLREFWLIAEALLNMGATTKGRIRAQDKQPSVLTTKDGRKLETRTLWDINRAMVAEAPDIILVVEAGLVDADPLHKLRLRVTTRRGRVWMSGTLEEGSQWFRDAYERWKEYPNKELGHAVSVPLYENDQDFPGGEKNPEINLLRTTLKPSVFSERVEGIPAASELLVFSKSYYRGNMPMCAKPLGFTRLDESGQPVPVEICVDPGHKPSHYYVGFMQKLQGVNYLVGEIAMLQATHEDVIRECKRRPEWENVTGGVIDPWAANQHGMGYQYTPHDIWLTESGFDLRLPEKAPTPPEIIERYLYFLAHPLTGECRFFFDPVRCPHFLAEWRKWKYLRDGRGMVLKNAPSKRNCDGIKAVGYKLVDEFNRDQFSKSFPTRQPKVGAWRFR